MILEKHKAYRGMVGRYLTGQDQQGQDSLYYCRYGRLGQLLFFRYGRRCQKTYLPLEELEVCDVTDLEGSDMHLYRGIITDEMRSFRQKIDARYGQDRLARLRNSALLDRYRHPDYANVYCVTDYYYGEKAQMLVKDYDSFFIFGSIWQAAPHHPVGESAVAVYKKIGTGGGLSFFEDHIGCEIIDPEESSYVRTNSYPYHHHGK